MVGMRVHDNRAASIQVPCPTMRAADGWESARFTSLFLASGFFCSQAESTLRPPAANADRWVRELKSTLPNQ